MLNKQSSNTVKESISKKEVLNSSTPKGPSSSVKKVTSKPESSAKKKDSEVNKKSVTNDKKVAKKEVSLTKDTKLKTQSDKKKIKRKIPTKISLDENSVSNIIQRRKFYSIIDGAPKDNIRIKIPKDAIHKVGKRKSSIARVWVWPIVNNEKSSISINGRDALSYFNNSPKALEDIAKPFIVIDEKISEYSVVCKFVGGGTSSQSEAARLGIAKCLLALLPHMRAPLKKEKLLRRDARVVEPKKTGLRGARKREQFSKR